MSHIVFHSVLEIVRILVNAMPSHHLHPHILKSVVQELLIDILWLAPGALKALDELIVVWAWWRPGKSSEGVVEIRSPLDEGEGGEGTHAVGLEDTVAFCGSEKMLGGDVSWGSQDLRACR